MDFANTTIKEGNEREAGLKLVNIIFSEVERSQGVSLPNYFDRYFSYSVAPDDVSDRELGKLFDFCASRDNTSLDQLLEKLIRRNAQVLIGRIRGRADEISSEVRELLAIALARNGKLFVSSTDTGAGISVRAATLVAELIVNRPGLADQRSSMAETVLENTQPLTFAVMIYDELFSSRRNLQAEWSEFRRDHELWPGDIEEKLRESLVDRIREAAKVRPPYAEWGPEQSMPLLNLWSSTAPGEVRYYIMDRVSQYPEEAIEVLKMFTGLSILGFYTLRRFIDLEAFANVLATRPVKSETWSEADSLISDFFMFKQGFDTEKKISDVAATEPDQG